MFAVDARLRLSTFKLLVAGLALALALMASERGLDVVFADLPRFRAEAELAALACIGGVVYGAAIAALFGRRWLRDFAARRSSSRPTPAGES